VLKLEQAIEFVREDEVVEVTPLSIRLRKNTEGQSPVRRRYGSWHLNPG
jgi:predicted membrane GTPase involved in stress response